MDKSFINKVQQIILEHLEDENLTVITLSNEIGLSRSQLLRKIKAVTGKTASEFIREIRLNEALRLIKERIIPLQRYRIVWALVVRPILINAFINILVLHREITKPNLKNLFFQKRTRSQII